MAEGTLPHLPEGHEPGPQSRRRLRDQRVGRLAWVPNGLRGRAPDPVEGLRLSVAAGALRRGDEVEGRLEVVDAGQVDERLEVGLLCDVWYDLEKGSGEDRARSTGRALVFEQWQPARPVQGVQALRFRVPADGAYSWEGTNLSFGWRLAARQPAGETDRISSAPFWVEP